LARAARHPDRIGLLIVQNSPTSLSLLKRAQGRNQDAWAHLLFLYTPLVDHWCRSWGIQGADADDLRQEVFQAVAAGLDSFRRDRPGDTFRGWLRVIARRKFLDHCRRQQGRPRAAGGTDAHRQMLQAPDPVLAEDDDPADQVTAVHHRALDLVRVQFEDRTWQAFWRCAVDGQSPGDVAREMNMTPAAVRQAKSRILRRLKEEFGDLLG
jgi:RNA polymerase sigma-70 factor, ECF subfamily